MAEYHKAAARARSEALSPERRTEIARAGAAARWSKGEPGTKHVYVLSLGDGPLKVGLAKNVRKRVAHIQIGNHREVVVIDAVEVQGVFAGAVEAHAHRLLDGRRVRGEWFAVEPAEALKAISDSIDAVMGSPATRSLAGCSDAVIFSVLLERAGAAGSVDAWATKHGFEASYIRDVLAGVHPFSPQIIAILSFERQHSQTAKE